MSTWNSGFDGAPISGDAPAEGADNIKNTRQEVRKRMDQEHVFYNTASTGQSIHRAGSAVAYYQAAAPTDRPEENSQEATTTALDADDTGRLWIDSDDENLHYWNGSSFADVDIGGSALYLEEATANIRAKVLTGVTAAGTATMAHGLTQSKIVGTAAISYTTVANNSVWAIRAETSNIVAGIFSTASGVTVKVVVFYTD